MPVGPPNLSLSFDDNLGPDVMQFYRGPLTWWRTLLAQALARGNSIMPTFLQA